MPSIHPDYEYDIFISYRHNDNRSGAISTLVDHIKEELAATIKSPLSIYFDTNPYDGLLENHDVDKSLARKLRSLIFIPILSQTYCDPESFAWKNEFCAFNDYAKEDKLGIDVKLNNGNVASRVLPIKIHNLDLEDTELIENKIGRTLRAIDFIFKSAGVNRPLQINDRREDNDNKLYYRDQINKVANAAKEILYGIKYPDRVQVAPLDKPRLEPEESSSSVISENSVAVLPFRNLAHDSSQEYFAEGIMENILMELSSSKDFKVISRTSVMRYKATEKSAREISTELGVKYILEGSAQSHANKVRINTHLIDAQEDQTVWSKVFVESLDDIFEIQIKVAETVAAELHGSIAKDEKDKPDVPTTDKVAYDLFLKGRHSFNQWGVDGYKAASDYFKQAVDRDPNFQQAYSYLASSYSARMSWNGDLSPSQAVEKINIYLDKAWQLGATDNDYLTKAFVEFFVTKDFNQSEALLKQAIEINSNNSLVYYTYSYLLNMMGRTEEAQQKVNQAKALDPLSLAYYNYQILCEYFQGNVERAIATLEEAKNLFPAVLRLYDFEARLSLAADEPQKAIDAVNKGLATTELRPPSMLAYMGIGFIKRAEFEQAKVLIYELEERSLNGEKGINFYLVHLYHALGDRKLAQQWLQKAQQTNDIDLIWLNVDPLLKGLKTKEEVNGSERDFEGAEQAIMQLFKESIPELPYHNLFHQQDVLSSAIEIAEAENVTEDDKKLLRLAVLLHDTGFIDHVKGHEARSVEIAREILPEFGFGEIEISKIEGMVMATRIPQQPTTKLEEIICDADLDYLGRDDFWEISQTLYEEYLQQGTVHSEREWNLVQRTFFESHHYHTEFSKKNRTERKQAHLQEIIEKLSTDTPSL